MTDAEVNKIVESALTACITEKGLDASAITATTQIFGSGSIIDSMDLVGVIVRIEEEVHEKTGKRIEVVDESSVISEDSPFKTVGSLSKYVMKKIHG